MEIYERLDVEQKGYITQQQLHAALNEAHGKPIRVETVRTLATRMDVTSRHGLKILYSDFLEYMAQKLLCAESYEDLLRSEQGPLMQEVGYKVYELLERFKRKQMLKDAMAGGDGIQRLLHLTTVPMAHRNRRKEQTGADLQSESGAQRAAAKKAGVGPSARGRSRPGGGAGGEGGNASRSIGDTSLASRWSLISRHSSGSGAENSAPAPATGATSSRSAKPGNGHGRPAARRQGRNSAPAAARASYALASLLGRMDGHDLERISGSGAVEDRGSSQRWRKNASHVTEEQHQQLSAAATSEQQMQQQIQQQQPAEAGLTVQVAGGPVTLTVVRPLSSKPSAQSSNTSTHNSSTSQPGSPRPGLVLTASAPAGAGASTSAGEGNNVWPARRLVPHASASAAPFNNAPAVANSNLFGRSAMPTPSVAVPGRGGAGPGAGRKSSPALIPLGLAGVGSGGHPLSASMMSAAGVRVEGWRSPVLMAQVLEAERIDVHSLVMDDLRATVGLSSSPTSLGRAHASQHPVSQTQAQGQAAQHLHQQLQLHSVVPQSLPLQHAMAPQPAPLASSPSSGLQVRSHSFSRQSPVPKEGEEPMDTAAEASSGDFGEGDSGSAARSTQRAEVHTHALTQLPPAQQLRQLQAPRHSQPHPQPPRRPQSQPLLQTQSQPQPQLQLQQSLPHHGNATERRRDGGPVGTWVTSDPEGVLGQLLRGSLSSSGQPRCNRSRFQATSAPDALRLDVSGPIESDPLLAKLPDWVRKGIGLPPAPAVRAVEPEPGAQPVTVADAVSPPLAPPAAAVEEPRADDDTAEDGGRGYNQQVGDSSWGSRSGSGSSSSQESLGVGGGARPGSSPGLADVAGGGGGYRPLMRGYSHNRQSMTRFLPFGGDVAAVVAEEESEGPNNETLPGGAPSSRETATPQAAAPAAGGGAAGAGAMSPDSPPAEAAPTVEELRKQFRQARSRSSSVRIHDPRVGYIEPRADSPEPGITSLGAPWTVSGQVGPELQTPALFSFSFRKKTSTWPGICADGAATEDGCAVGAGDGDGATAAVEWLGRDTEAPATQEALAAWEASVMSQRSSVGHGSLCSSMREMVPQEGEEEDEGEKGDGEDDEDAAGRLTGRSGSVRRAASGRTSVADPTERPVVAPALHNQQQQPQRQSHPPLHAHRQQQEPQAQQRQPEPAQAPQPDVRQPRPGQEEEEEEEVEKSGLQRSEAGEHAAGGYTTPSWAVAAEQQVAEGQAGGSDSSHLAGPDDCKAVLVRSASSRGASCTRGGPHGLRRPASQPLLQPAKPQRPPFYTCSHPRSAELLPSAAAVVAAAEVAAAAEAAAAAAASRVSDDGLGPSLWSSDYVSDDVIAASGRPTVRLNHTAMLRMRAQYGSEMVASAGAALGLGGSSAAAREIASRELLHALASHGSGRVPPLLPSTPTIRDAALTAPLPMAAACPSSGPSQAHPQRRRSSTSGGGGGGGNAPPQGRISGSGSAAFLPHDAVGLGRQISRQASKRSSESDSSAAGNGAGAGGARPVSARATAAAPASGPVPRPASARPPRNPAFRHAAAAPSAAGPACARSPHTTMRPQPDTRVRPASAKPASAGPAAAAAAAPRFGVGANRRPLGRSASALAPTSLHQPPSSSIGRVRQLDQSEVTSCFTATHVANGGSAAAVCHPLSPASPASPVTPPTGPGPVPGWGFPGRRSSSLGGTPGGNGVGGACTVHGSTSSASTSSAAGGSRGASAWAGGMGAVEGGGGGGGEERRRRALEVMGTGALIGTVARKGSVGVGAVGAVAGSAGSAAGEASTSGRLAGVVARAR